MDTADELNPLGLLVGIKKIRSLYFDILAFLCVIGDNRLQSIDRDTETETHRDTQTKTQAKTGRDKDRGNDNDICRYRQK